MECKVILFLGFIALAACNDLIVGNNDGQKIFDKKEEKGWAMSAQNDNVTVTANDTGVITGVNVTDLRENKDGEAKIVDGGVGQKNVTINLKSPGPFRGYEFQVEVHAASEEEYIKNGGSDDKKNEPSTTKQVPVAEPKNEVSSTKIPPANLAKDMIVNKREANEQSQSTAAPKVTSTDAVQTSAKNVDTQTAGAVISSTPIITGIPEQTATTTVKPEPTATTTVKPKTATDSVGAKTHEQQGKDERGESGEGIERLAYPTPVTVGEAAGIPTLAKNVYVDAKTNAPVNIKAQDKKTYYQW